MTEVSTEILFRFVKPFDGDKNKLNSFVKNCNSAYKLAGDNQKDILFSYIQSQITGKAELIVSTRELKDWPTFRDFILENFSETKEFSQLILELQSCKQQYNENVLDFTQRVEKSYSNLVRSAKSVTSDANQLLGKLDMIKQLVLQTFLVGIKDQYSVILRARNPSSFEIASEIALAEEKLMNFARQTNNKTQKVCLICKKPGHDQYNCRSNPKEYYHKPQFHKREVFQINPKKCNYCGLQGHLIAQCRKRMNNFNNNQNNTSSNSSNNKSCKYCKKSGHNIEECRKRQYNNNRNFNLYKQTPNQTISNSNNNDNQNRTLNSNHSEIAVVSRNMEQQAELI